MTDMPYCPACSESYPEYKDLEELDEDFEDCLGAATCPVICRKCGAKLDLNAYTTWELTVRGTR